MVRVWDVIAVPHRHLKRDRYHPQRGRDVRGVQNAVGRFADNHPRLEITRLEIDGEAGRQTIAQGREVARLLGLVLRKPGLTVSTQLVLRAPRLRTPAQRKRALERQAARREEIKRRDQKPRVVGNTVRGGTPRQRLAVGLLQACRNYIADPSSRFYSMPGFWDVKHAITGEPRGARSDCSQFVIAMSNCCDVADPSGTGFAFGNTDTLAAHCREIRRDQLEVGDFAIYFYPGGGTHHVEAWYGDGEHSYAELARMGSSVRDRTVGHGSKPVDFGDIDMMAGVRFFRHPAKT